MPAIERQAGLFDYDALTPTTRDIVQRRTGEIQNLMRRSATDIVDIGLKLEEVKGILGHGNFGVWLESEFGWAERTARNFMQVADVFKTANFADLDIAPSALYALASPSTPAPVREEFRQRAEAGEKITHKAVQARKIEHVEQFKPVRPVVTLDAQPTAAFPPFDPETGEVSPTPVFAGPDVAALIQPDPQYVIQKNEVEQALEQVGWDDASKLEGVLARAIAALTALSTYAPVDLSRIADSGAGKQLQVPTRLSRTQQLCSDVLRLAGKDGRTVNA